MNSRDYLSQNHEIIRTALLIAANNSKRMAKESGTSWNKSLVPYIHALEQLKEWYDTPLEEDGGIVVANDYDDQQIRMGIESVMKPDYLGEDTPSVERDDFSDLEGQLIAAIAACREFNVEDRPEKIHRPIEAHLIGSHMLDVLLEARQMVESLRHLRRGHVAFVNQALLEGGLQGNWNIEGGSTLEVRCQRVAAENVRLFLQVHQDGA